MAPAACDVPHARGSRPQHANLVLVPSPEEHDLRLLRKALFPGR
jgi:hypothetical protein